MLLENSNFRKVKYLLGRIKVNLLYTSDNESASIAERKLVWQISECAKLLQTCIHKYIVLSTECKRVRGTLQLPRLRLIRTVFGESWREFTCRLNFSH